MKLDQFEAMLQTCQSVEGLTLIAKALLAHARVLDNATIQLGVLRAREQHLLRLVLEAEFDSRRMRVLLRQALRGWVLRTPDVEEAALAWDIAREAGLGQ